MELKVKNMKKIRKNVFETNSSSTHSLVFCSDDEYKKIKSGRLYIGLYDDEFYTEEEFDKIVKEAAEECGVSVEEVLDNPKRYEIPVTLDEWIDLDYNLEYSEYTHTTKSGEKVHALCKYGYDG